MYAKCPLYDSDSGCVVISVGFDPLRASSSLPSISSDDGVSFGPWPDAGTVPSLGQWTGLVNLGQIIVGTLELSQCIRCGDAGIATNVRSGRLQQLTAFPTFALGFGYRGAGRIQSVLLFIAVRIITSVSSR